MPFKKTTKPTIVYKAVRHPETDEPIVAVLRLPRGTTYYELSERAKLRDWYTKKVYISSAKCRAECAIVVRFIGTRRKTAVSDYDQNFTYRIGKKLRPTRPFSKRRVQCASGIHFFFDKNHAASYLF